MQFEKTKIKGVYIIKPRVFEDSRGYFFESYNAAAWDKAGLNYQWVQDNQSFSTYGTIRGLHFQTGDAAQAKLVRAVSGTVYDVAVDLRPGSETYGKHVGVELSDHNNFQLLIPRGFAHGFAVLSKDAIFAYKCDNFYNKGAEGGLIYDDPALKINWGIQKKDHKLSDKDALLPTLENYIRQGASR